MLLVEKEPKIGGNSAKASSGINAAISKDDEPVFEKDTLKSGGGLSNEAMVDYFIKQVCLFGFAPGLLLVDIRC